MSRKSNWGQLLQIHEIRVLLAGALLISSLLVSVLLVSGYLYTHAVGRREFKAAVAFDDGTGIGRGTKVLVRGVEVGSVDDIGLNEDGRVIMTLKIPESYRRMIRTNWVCYPMRDRNLVSDRVLNIDDTAIDPVRRRENLRRFPPIASTGPITFHTTSGRDVESMMQMVSNLANQAQGTLNRINEILDRVNDTSGSLGLLLNSKDAYLTGMQALQETRSAISETREAVSQGRQGISSLTRTGALIERRTPTMVDSLQVLLSSASHSARAIERVVGRTDSITITTRDMLDRAGDLIDHSDRLIDGASKTWPLRPMLRNSGSKSDRIPASPLP
jgi:phospholipid/cholesterol/gamma-HCH transport system substrate-binding protein